MNGSHTSPPRRNRGYMKTHRDIVEEAVRLLADKGAEALSIAELARQLGVDRTTVYHHFQNKQQLIEAVMAWSSEQLTTAFGPTPPSPEQNSFISHFVLDNPALIRLWVDRFIKSSDIRESYPEWDLMVQTTRDHMSTSHPHEAIDTEIFCMILLMATIIGPLAYCNSVEPGAAIEMIVERFRRELARILHLPSI